VHDSVATEDHRGEAACDDREKKAGCDGVLHREGPQRNDHTRPVKQGRIKLAGRWPGHGQVAFGHSYGRLTNERPSPRRHGGPPAPRVGPSLVDNGRCRVNLRPLVNLVRDKRMISGMQSARQAHPRTPPLAPTVSKRHLSLSSARERPSRRWRRWASAGRRCASRPGGRP